ncbi:hypothetical protein [Hymenobacter mucosus]|uniref:Uncharacterized protein n=1 Tax=Hymenobacter mucosus TaxID=1411120 RepID=A0A238Y736_9BACT|nr:hypothetical protein [Hymenobacter mucosus]SNR67086.1 hypothetical protein SAMN06269173_10515 [Hymenobacter mucosus]
MDQHPYTYKNYTDNTPIPTHDTSTMQPAWWRKALTTVMLCLLVWLLVFWG